MSVRARPAVAVAVLLAAMMTFLLLMAASPSGAPVPGSISDASAFTDKDCSDFSTQKRAQRFFKRHKPRRDRHRLDGDNDGIACESNPCPCNKKPAFRKSASGLIARR
jgi:Excalibur calcium-binding domain